MEVVSVHQQDRGGKEDERLPDRLDVMRLAAARINEIQALTHAIEEPQRTGLVFQKLPRHMRRRAMSRNPKRLPAHLRAAHIQQMSKSGPQPESKRPSRKYRRRPSNLLKEYNRRQHTHVWLETHIWHAKRFHMMKKWNYHLAHSPNDRSFRACYRASTSHCLLQDVSYLCCVELLGKQTDLLEGLSKHASPQCGPTFAARTYIAGGREGSLFFYAADKYPLGGIGAVTFLWRPQVADTDSKRTIWILTHPAYYSEVVEQLTSTFGLAHIEVDSDKTDLAGQRVHAVLLKDSLNRFRLTGPLSQAVLQEGLHLVEDGNGTHKDLWSRLSGIWSPGMLPAETVLTLNVVDPRLNLPTKRTKATTEPCGDWSVPVKPNDVLPLDSNIWNSSGRESVTKAKMSEADLNAERSKLLLPGSVPAIASPVIPVLLIQRPGNRDEQAARVGLGCGWDVILPSGWAMPFWLAFVFRGGRTCGLREANALAFECGKNYVLNPDTHAGRAEDMAQEKALKEKHFRLPPDKRVNFRKLSVASPFRCPWLELLRDWDEREIEVDEIFVLRDYQKLDDLQEALTKFSRNADGPQCSDKYGWGDDSVGCLVPVRVELIKGGMIKDLASICAPTLEDMKALADNKAVSEPLQSDSKQVERRTLRWKHEKLLKRLRRERVKEKRVKSEKGEVIGRDSKEPPTKRLVEEQAKKMEELWLPDGLTVKDLASRTTMGFLTKGDSCFGSGLSRGVGYVALKSLKHLAQTLALCDVTPTSFKSVLRKGKTSCLWVLVRSPHSQQYWPARLHLNSDLGHLC